MTAPATPPWSIRIAPSPIPVVEAHRDTPNLLLAQLGRALVEQIRAGEAARDPVAFAARWEQIVRELEGAL